MMTREEALIRSIIGPSGGDVCPLAHAVRIMIRLLFSEHMSQDDVQMRTHIYPEVARLTGKTESAVSRQIERVENLCWEHLDAVGQRTYIGKQLRDIRAPRDIMIYLAYYSHFNIPYYEVLKNHPEILFAGDVIQK